VKPHLCSSHMPSRYGQGQLELYLYVLSTYAVYLKQIQLKLSTSFCMHCSQCTNHLASAHKLLSPLPTHGDYGANFSPILTAVYFHDLHAPSWHDVSVQELLFCVFHAPPATKNNPSRCAGVLVHSQTFPLISYIPYQLRQCSL